MSTPKAFTNFSPGLELATTQGTNEVPVATLKAFANSRMHWPTLTALFLPVVRPTQGCTNPGLEFANAFGVFAGGAPFSERHLASAAPFCERIGVFRTVRGLSSGAPFCERTGVLPAVRCLASGAV